ncbi:MAG: hypothetical protein HOQ41_18290 [Ensifer adhaerens]|nr:hypothetical protein [Ensifer adhaerens]
MKNELGFAVLPAFAAEAAGFTPLLPEVPPLAPDLWLLVHEQSAELPRVRLTKEAVATVMARFAARSAESA